MVNVIDHHTMKVWNKAIHFTKHNILRSGFNYRRQIIWYFAIRGVDDPKKGLAYNMIIPNNNTLDEIEDVGIVE